VLAIVVEDKSYEYGFFEVTGVVENVGTAPVYSLALRLDIYSSSGETLLASDTTWPAGCLLEYFDPGEKAAFHFITHVPGEPKSIKWRVRPDEETEAEYTVDYGD